ncbi:taste receptor type 2 member 1-like [Gracilinanus agilis]|uniref:taste receptor type 2 member 1-like n=1 Tax=Gracilinanus agilis TaxID=191870 RepID=UPI001CFE949C|nr:taste receptor type 2 member 1-like [Gracilinanus agilis]
MSSWRMGPDDARPQTLAVEGAPGTLDTPESPQKGLHQERLGFLGGSMISLAETCYATVLIALFIIGAIGNGFLVVVNSNKLIRDKRLIGIELLLLCLGMSRLGLQILLTFQGLISVFFGKIYLQNVYGPLFLFIWMFLNSSSLWFATCLGIFYCLKISDFTHPSFLWLKFRVFKLMPWMLLGSLLASVVIAVLCACMLDYSTVSNTDWPKNVSQAGAHSESVIINDVLLVNFVLVFPLGLFVMCTAMLFVSLYSHTHRMQTRSLDLGNPNTEAHINALRTVITFFCFFISYFAALMVNLTFTVPFKSHWFFFLKSVMAAYPSGHSVIIILGNSQYRQSFGRILNLLPSFPLLHSTSLFSSSPPSPSHLFTTKGDRGEPRGRGHF